MNRYRYCLLAHLMCAVALPACSGSGNPSSPATNGTSTTASQTTSTVGTTTGTSTTTGSAQNTAAASTTANTAGSTTSTNGASTTGLGGGATTSSSSNDSTTGGGASSTGSSSETTGGGTGGTGNTPTGGASAAAVCEPGASYGNPLDGMGSVQEISAPQSSYFAFLEGPVWVGSVGTLFFSDNASSPTERIWKLVPPSTTPEIFMEASGSNGLAIDGDDQLILADQRDRQITRVDNMSATVLDTLAGPGSYKPNDLIVRSDGSIYFTDPDSGFYHVSTNGEVSPANKGVSRPNGVVLSPDENTLYVGDVGNREIHAFAVGSDGSVGSGGLFVTAQNQTVDGMAIDCAGNLYAGTANGVEVFTPSGEPIGIVPTGESSNATFGGADRKTLYVTSRALLKAVTLAVPGLPD